MGSPILIGIGGNLPGEGYGTPLATCAAALDAVDQVHGIAVVRRSRWHRSLPVPLSAQPTYINAVAEVMTGLEPAALLAALHDVERAFGRRRGERNEARTVDLDLLAYGTLVSELDAAVVVPHPRMHQRAFVLGPLLELAADWRHPLLGASAAELLAALPPGQIAEPLEVGVSDGRGAGRGDGPE